MCFALISLFLAKTFFTLSTLNAATTLLLHYLGRIRLRINILKWETQLQAEINHLNKNVFFIQNMSIFSFALFLSLNKMLKKNLCV